jgi:hypothetical protein
MKQAYLGGISISSIYCILYATLTIKNVITQITGHHITSLKYKGLSAFSGYYSFNYKV